MSTIDGGTMGAESLPEKPQMDVKTFLMSALEYARDIQIDYDECELSVYNLRNNILPLKRRYVVIGCIRVNAEGKLYFEKFRS